MKIMIIGASRGLGRALFEGLAEPGNTMIGVSRSLPRDLKLPRGAYQQWIYADFSSPRTAVQHIEAESPDTLDTLICNIGIWEKTAFSDSYAFLQQTDDETISLVDVNITSILLLLKRLIPKLLSSNSAKPQILLTGSTSGLRQSGRPEMAFGASKTALNGIADALRENFREEQLAVTSLQLGYLNTDDDLSVPRDTAAHNGNGELIPVHDVVNLVKTLLTLSEASFVRELVLPAIKDPRF